MLDNADLENFLFTGKHESIINYFEDNYMIPSYYVIKKKMNFLLQEVIKANLKEKLPTKFNRQAKDCYSKVVRHFEKKDEVRQEEIRNSKDSLEVLVIQ